MKHTQCEKKNYHILAFAVRHCLPIGTVCNLNLNVHSFCHYQLKHVLLLVTLSYIIAAWRIDFILEFEFKKKGIYCYYYVFILLCYMIVWRGYIMKINCNQIFNFEKKNI